MVNVRQSHQMFSKESYPVKSLCKPNSNKQNKQTNKQWSNYFILTRDNSLNNQRTQCSNVFFLSGFPDEERPVRLNPYLAWTLTDRLDRLRLGVQLGHWTGHHSWNCLDIHKEDERKCRYQGCAPRPSRPAPRKKGLPRPAKIGKTCGRGGAKVICIPWKSKSTTPSLSLPW